jgi:CHAD domain-containing protein
MFRALTPINILQNHATTLAGTLPRLYDGEVEAVHEARVASRRIRQVLPLTDQWHRTNTIEDMTAKFREIGRSLGRVRDADARLAMLSSLESRIPPAAPSLVVLRRHHDHLRWRLMRKLIKGFERLEVPIVLRNVGEGRTQAHRPWVRVGVGWQDQLRRSVKQRAQATCDSVHHTTGVYFPNRLHTTRIAVKKCRYAVEIAGETGVGPGVDDMLRFLKNTQDVLGDLHDRQILIDELSAMAAPAPADIDPEHIRLVIQIVEAECRELHAKYLKRRARLLEICERLKSMHSPRRAPIAPVATAVAAAAAVYLMRRRARVPAQMAAAAPPSTSPHGAEVSVRIPIPGAVVARR